MKIKTQLTLTTLIFCIIFILTGSSLLYTYYEVNRLSQQEEIAQGVVRGAYELSYLSNDYLFHPEEQRQNIQWNSRFAVLSGEISRLSTDQPDQQKLISRITANKDRLHDVYLQSVAAIEAAKAVPGQPVDPELIDVAWSRFVVQNQAMIFDASSLSQLLHEKSAQVQRINTVLIFLFMGVLLLFLVTNYVFFRQRVLQSLSALHNGIKVIGTGDLDFRIDTGHDDEIGELSVAFNRMTANLGEVTASKSDLEQEITSRTQAEDALRDARDNLEIKVQKRTEQLTDANKDLQQEIIERKRVDDALRESEKKYHNIFDNAIIGIYQTTPDGFLISANMAMARILGYENPEDLLAEIHNITEQLYANPDDRKEVIRILTEHGVIEHFEVPVRHRMGTEIFASITGRAVKDANGNVVFYEGSIVDITKSKRAEEEIRHNLEEKEVLLREIHHRVKNNLASIISLIGIQTSYLSDKGQLATMHDLETRIRSMALVHETLYQSNNLSAISAQRYVEDLTNYLANSYGSGTDIRWNIDMDDITLPIDMAIPCGLIISEIVTNSLKYAFPGTWSCPENRGAPCEISLTMKEEEEYFVLSASDNGTGIPPGMDLEHSKSMGIFLIRLLSKNQLRGSLDVDTTRGTSYTLRFLKDQKAGK